MTKRRAQATEAAQDQQQTETDASQRPGNKLLQAQEKLARMEETNRICYRNRADFTKIEDELKKFNYSQSELDHILEPKGAKNIPGYSFFEMESQKQFVKRMSSRGGPADSHVAGVDESRESSAPVPRFCRPGAPPSGSP